VVTELSDGKVTVTRKYKRKPEAETLLKNKRKINMNKHCSTINA
jgi:hypothetical protein